LSPGRGRRRRPGARSKSSAARRSGRALRSGLWEGWLGVLGQRVIAGRGAGNRSGRRLPHSTLGPRLAVANRMSIRLAPPPRWDVLPPVACIAAVPPFARRARGLFAETRDAAARLRRIWPGGPSARPPALAARLPPVAPGLPCCGVPRATARRLRTQNTRLPPVHTCVSSSGSSAASLWVSAATANLDVCPGAERAIASRREVRLRAAGG
jgi:hypothetical protein